jgi:hypothetical protein
MRCAEQPSWKAVVAEALSSLGGQGRLSEIYERLKDHPKTATNPTWRDTVRRVVRQYGIFEPVPPERSGVYRLVSAPQIIPAVARFEHETPELDHGAAQGMLVALGAVYGYETFVPKIDQKTREFKGRELAQMVTVRDCADVFSSANIDRIREIDVLWFEEDDDGLYPTFAFEVEHTTNVRDGVDRLLKIPARYQTHLFVVGPDDTVGKRFERLIGQQPFVAHKRRFQFRSYAQLEALHNAAMQHQEQRTAFGVWERGRTGGVG